MPFSPQGRLKELGFESSSIHHAKDPVKAVTEAQALFVGGGNGFRLLKELYKHEGLVEARDSLVFTFTSYTFFFFASDHPLARAVRQAGVHRLVGGHQRGGAVHTRVHLQCVPLHNMKLRTSYIPSVVPGLTHALQCPLWRRPRSTRWAWSRASCRPTSMTGRTRRR